MSSATTVHSKSESVTNRDVRVEIDENGSSYTPTKGVNDLDASDVVIHGLIVQVRAGRVGVAADSVFTAQLLVHRSALDVALRSLIRVACCMSHTPLRRESPYSHSIPMQRFLHRTRKGTEL